MAASTRLTPSQRSQRARLAALAKARKYGAEGTAAARAAFRAKYADEAELREHMMRLAFASSKARGRA